MPNIKFTELAKGAKIGGRLGIVVDASGVWQPREVANMVGAKDLYAVH
jgi:hypothetical protein